jgi:hypothetical protein
MMAKKHKNLPLPEIKEETPFGNYTPLVPTNQWVYYLYSVKFYDDYPGNGGKELEQFRREFVSTDNHAETILWEDFRPACDNEIWAVWDVVDVNVYHPRVVGHFYNVSIHESPREHTQWILELKKAGKPYQYKKPK